MCVRGGIWNKRGTKPKGLVVGRTSGAKAGRAGDGRRNYFASFGSGVVHRDTWKLRTAILEFFLGYLNNPE